MLVLDVKMMHTLLCVLGFFWITAENPPTRHYRVKNSSLCLHVGKPPPYHQVTWLFNERAIVLSDKITPDYTDKVDFNASDFSLCINKLTETDSGIYKVTFFDSGFKSSIETHRLIVEETVPRPVIKMSVMHSNQSAGLCNITVNCFIQDDWMLSVCDGDSCRTSQKSFRRLNITMSSGNRSIVCSGSNHVSTSNVSENIEAACVNESNPEHEETSKSHNLIVIVIAVCVSLGTLIFCVAKRRFSTENNHHQYFRVPPSTVELRESQPVEAQPQHVPRTSTSSSSQAEVSYENVEAPQSSQTCSPTISPRRELGSKQRETVDTVYSYLQAPNGTTSPGSNDSSKDTKEHRKDINFTACHSG